jgi:S1-C subfamily serine protease
MASNKKGKNNERVTIYKKDERKFPWAIAIILAIIVIQSGFIIYLAYNISYTIPYEQNLTRTFFNKKIDASNANFQKNIADLSNKISGVTQTQTDLGKQISLIAANTSSDFSGLIKTAVKSVVSIHTDVAQGTGFLISPDGYVVTNAHVLSGAKYADAIMSDKTTETMDLIGYDVNYDVALLKINGDYNYLSLRDSNNIRVGEKVIAIGNPLGLSFSVSEGIVSAINREGDNGISAYIQTDAALNPGNSGGPLIGTDGKVIGINNFKANAENIGFALESNYLRDSVNSIALKKLNMTILD